MPEEITELTELTLSKVPNIIRYNDKGIINDQYIKYKSNGKINNDFFHFRIKRFGNRLYGELDITENSDQVSDTLTLIQTILDINFIVDHETCDKVVKRLYKSIKHLRVNQ